MSTQQAFPLFMPMSYEQYRSSSQWRGARAAALLRAGNRCALNADHTEDLDVLHSSRERLGAELDCDVVVLCASCRSLMGRALSGGPDSQRVAHAVPVREVFTGTYTGPAFAAPSGPRWRPRRRPAFSPG